MSNDPFRLVRKRIRYGREHRLARIVWGRTADAGLEVCTRCNLRIRAGQPWHLDHNDDGVGYRGVSHARCNEQAGARKRWQRGPGPSRDWAAG